MLCYVMLCYVMSFKVIQNYTVCLYGDGGVSLTPTAKKKEIS
jgi:hypothetical protein